MFELYEHQQTAYRELQQGYADGHMNQVLSVATGGGKTVIASHLAQQAAEKGGASLFIVHMKTLAQQAANHLRAVGLKVGILRGEDTDYDQSCDVVVASIQTIKSRSAPDWVRLVIIDECHVLHKEHIRLIESWTKTPFIGLSATPLREDLGKYFTNLVRGPSVQWLTENEFLVPAYGYVPSAEAIKKALQGVATGNSPQTGVDYRQGDLNKAMNKKPLIGDIISTYERHGEDRQFILFAVSKAHSQSITEDFNGAGIPTAHIEDRTPETDRHRFFEAFRKGELRGLSSVGVLSVGFDMPIASCVILARPTLSETLHFQQVGRGIRTAEGKRDCIVLDHAGNVLQHGLPVYYEVPDLDDREHQTASQKRRNAKMVVCLECGRALDPDELHCPGCGTDRPKRRNDVTHAEGDLVAFGSDSEGEKVVSMEERRSWFQQLLWVGLHRKGKDQEAAGKYANAIYHEKFDMWAPRRWKTDLEPVMPTPEVNRWLKHKAIAWKHSRRNPNNKSA